MLPDERGGSTSIEPPHSVPEPVGAHGPRAQSLNVRSEVVFEGSQLDHNGFFLVEESFLLCSMLLPLRFLRTRIITVFGSSSGFDGFLRVPLSSTLLHYFSSSGDCVVVTIRFRRRRRRVLVKRRLFKLVELGAGTSAVGEIIDADLGRSDTLALNLQSDVAILLENTVLVFLSLSKDDQRILKDNDTRTSASIPALLRPDPCALL